jgi:hypothetical protein
MSKIEIKPDRPQNPRRDLQRNFRWLDLPSWTVDRDINLMGILFHNNIKWTRIKDGFTTVISNGAQPSSCCVAFGYGNPFPSCDERSFETTIDARD